MTDDLETNPEDERPFAPKTYVATLPGWKKALIGGAVLLIGVAAVTMAFEEPATANGASGGPPLASGLSGGGTGEGADGQTPWSEAFFRFGFSFFIGFAVGYATRAFLKLVMFLAGGLAICLFLLSYFEFITVNWQQMDDSFQEFVQVVKGQFGEFRSFITGSLPNAGLAGLGLFAGFKKNG